MSPFSLSTVMAHSFACVASAGCFLLPQPTLDFVRGSEPGYGPLAGLPVGRQCRGKEIALKHPTQFSDRAPVKSRSREHAAPGITELRQRDSLFPLNFLLSYSGARAGDGALARVQNLIYRFLDSEAKTPNVLTEILSFASCTNHGIIAPNLPVLIASSRALLPS